MEPKERIRKTRETSNEMDGRHCKMRNEFYLWIRKAWHRENYIYNMYLTALKGTTPVNETSATDWLMVARRDNVISIALYQVY